MSEIQNKSHEDAINNTKEQLDKQKIIDFLNSLEGEEILQEYQKNLDQRNTELWRKVEDNSNEVKNKLNLDFSIVYGIENEKRADVDINKWQWFQWDLSNTQDYISSITLDATERVNNSDYWDFWHDLLGQYYDGDITFDELWELDQVPYEEYRNWEYGNEDIFIRHEQRNLSEHEENLLDAIHDPETEYDLLWYLLSELDNANPEDYKGISPLDILQERYENASEWDKIELAKTMSRYMNDYGYDDSLPNGDVSSEDMWNSYREWWVAWVCRHHHSEVAKFLASVWIQSWVITTNSGWGHAITWWKKDDGWFFMIDYWHYYEWDDPKELQARYLATKGAIELQGMITDEKDNIIWTLQTQLQELFQNTTSSIWTWDSLAYSQYLGQEWNDINEWVHIKVQKWFNGAWDEFSASYWAQKWNLWAEASIYHHESKDVDYADFTSTGARLKVQLGDEANKLWKIEGWAQLSKNEFKYDTQAKADYVVAWVHLAHTKKVYEDDNTKIATSTVAQSQLMWHIQSAKEDGGLWLQDGTTSLWTSINIEQEINDKWKLHWGLSYGWDIMVEGVRGSERREDEEDGFIKSVKTGINYMKFYDKKSVFGGATYTTNNLSVWANASHERWLGYNKTIAGLSASKWKIEVWAEVEVTDNSKNPFLLSEKEIRAEIVWKASDILRFSVEGESWSNWVSNRDEIKVGATAKF